MCIDLNVPIRVFAVKTSGVISRLWCAELRRQLLVGVIAYALGNRLRAGQPNRVIWAHRASAT